MKIKFFKSHELEKPFRLSVHRSGKLGFTSEAAKALELTQEKSISIGQNEEDESDARLYMVVHETVEDGAFKVAKAGAYFYLPIKLLLDNLQIPYETESIAFKMEKVNDGGAIYYRLTRLENEKRGSNVNEEEPQEEPEEEETEDDI